MINNINEGEAECDPGFTQRRLIIGATLGDKRLCGHLMYGRRDVGNVLLSVLLLLVVVSVVVVVVVVVAVMAQ